MPSLSFPDVSSAGFALSFLAYINDKLPKFPRNASTPNPAPLKLYELFREGLD